MRIVQLSDIHLSNTNLSDLQNFYLSALISDLKEFNKEKLIDVILLTGDLLDKGGESFGDVNAYNIFEEEFINPLLNSLGISKDKILFIAGNHDIDKNHIKRDNEYYLANTLTKEGANEALKENYKEFNNTNHRIEKFKQFEKKFHCSTEQYVYSNNESLSIELFNDFKIGFALINDSWRCSPELKKEQHFIGYNQLFNAKKYFAKENTKINIAVFHHPLEILNNGEKEEIENILKSQNFDLAIFGHKHEHKIESLISSSGGIVSLNGRSTFNCTTEKESKYQPGYNILDLDANNKTYILHARKFIRADGYRFDKDVESIKDGILKGSLDINNYFLLNKTINTIDVELPGAYSADVKNIVKLLIGKSLYPNPYIFVRELIQNAVDACNRLKEKQTHLIPRITVKIDTAQNYFEIADEGDGMSKRILKEHFSIIGKSISEEFNIATGNFNLISQFGIGFISTFRVAQKVWIATKNENSESISFEIEDVFKEFNYTPAEMDIKREQTGTTIRVYLKKEYSPHNIVGQALQYCRHIENIDFYLDSVLQTIQKSWNVENGFFFIT